MFAKLVLLSRRATNKKKSFRTSNSANLRSLKSAKASIPRAEYMLLAGTDSTTHSALGLWWDRDDLLNFLPHPPPVHQVCDAPWTAICE